MFSKMSVTKSTKTYSDEVKKLKEALVTADAVVIGAGAGLSTSAGFTYSGERFHKNFSDFEDKYGFKNLTAWRTRFYNNSGYKKHYCRYEMA